MFWIRLVGASAALLSALASAHVTLEQPQAAAGSAYKAVFKVGHACAGATATTGITVRLPAGFRGAQPIPKAGWTARVQRAPLAVPYESHGRRITEDVVEVSWRANNADAALPGAFYDEFTVRGTLPASEGALWFKVLQSCDVGEADWAEVPASGTSTEGLKAPAARLLLGPAPAAVHVH
ncbi:YcnI family protein [Curvibacter sp. HBC28]|uniref:YcnI family protein n=1 Tax=Curvibacter microcysteis TaxID=3026419 RepID=A0ABT5MKF4_9BURK|nr:YcnI family protein [Curvibacter sp. HBC28]MDD0817068.1 YcnI family protein [Curvibacter sp. HBC28]